jgi:hypothetical protein
VNDEPLQLSLADEVEADETSWHEWFLSLPLGPEASPQVRELPSERIAEDRRQLEAA